MRSASNSAAPSRAGSRVSNRPEQSAQAAPTEIGNNQDSLIMVVDMKDIGDQAYEPGLRIKVSNILICTWGEARTKVQSSAYQKLL